MNRIKSCNVMLVVKNKLDRKEMLQIKARLNNF